MRVDAFGITQSNSSNAKTTQPHARTSGGIKARFAVIDFDSIHQRTSPQDQAHKELLRDFGSSRETPARSLAGAKLRSQSLWSASRPRVTPPHASQPSRPAREPLREYGHPFPAINQPRPR